MKYAFHPEALVEYSKAVEHYATQDADVAQSFINAVEDAVYRIKTSPNRYPLTEVDVRRCLTKKFSYGILYSVESDFILILAVMNCRKKPGYWRSRLKP